jgi:hypothetical protein
MELRGLIPNVHIHVSAGSDLYIPTILLQENMWTDPGNICINRSQTHEFRIGTEATQFLF